MATNADTAVPVPADPAARSQPLGVGSMLDSYRLLEKLGEGGMGAVYKAEHAKLRKTVAVKVLPQRLTADPDSVARFEQEMAAIGQLDHPHIVRATDAGEVNGTHFLVMEYVEGIDLQKYVATRGPVPMIEACEMICQAALGLGHAHQQGFVHRDVKPSNLLLTKDGKIKLLDLGLARLQADHPVATRLTATGTFMGTSDYMAPEQWDDAKNVEGRADLYALGCTLFCLLTGRAPFEDERHESMARKMVAHTLEPIPDLQQARLAALARPTGSGSTAGPEEAETHMAESVVGVYQKLMAKRPEQRFATAEELVLALRDVMKPGSVSPTTSAQVDTGKVTARISARVALSKGSPPVLLVAPFAAEPAQAAQWAWATFLGKASPIERNSVGMDLVLIPPAKFQMGSPTDDGAARSDEQPQVQVTLTNAFYMSRTVVTQGQWQEVMNTTPWKGWRKVKEGPDFPATHVNWYEAREFCRKLEQRAGLTYRLPTEAEWEYACRAGTTTRYHFGDDDGALGAHAWYAKNANDIGETYAHAVGQKQPNAFRLYDMHGNVWEWCEDVYVDKLWGGQDPVVTIGGSDRVHRGGSWRGTAEGCRLAYRNFYSPGVRGYNLGFRPVAVESR